MVIYQYDESYPDVKRVEDIRVGISKHYGNRKIIWNHGDLIKCNGGQGLWINLSDPQCSGCNGTCLKSKFTRITREVGYYHNLDIQYESQYESKIYSRRTYICPSDIASHLVDPVAYFRNMIIPRYLNKELQNLIEYCYLPEKNKKGYGCDLMDYNVYYNMKDKTLFVHDKLNKYPLVKITPQNHYAYLNNHIFFGVSPDYYSVIYQYQNWATLMNYYFKYGRNRKVIVIESPEGDKFVPFDGKLSIRDKEKQSQGIVNKYSPEKIKVTFRKYKLRSMFYSPYAKQTEEYQDYTLLFNFTHYQINHQKLFPIWETEYQIKKVNGWSRYNKYYKYQIMPLNMADWKKLIHWIQIWESKECIYSWDVNLKIWQFLCPN